MRIVHLSDIHLNKEDLKNFQEFVLPALIKDLDEYNSNQKIDLVLITGDLIDKGGKSLGGIENALKLFVENVIEPIKNEFGLGYEKFFFVPGNHDIDENVDSPRIEKGLTADLGDTDSVNKFIDEDTLEGIERILPYKKFEEEYYKNCVLSKDITNFQSSYVINIEGTTIGVNCLNTAWRCYNSKTDKEKILLGERQIINGYKKIKDCDIKIALMHHQPDWLAKFDRESIESLLFEYYDLLFCGHVHKGSTWNTNRSYGELFFSIAPINFAGNIRSENRIYSNGYSILDYDPELGEIILNYRRYNHIPLHAYVSNTDEAKEGKGLFKINCKINKKKTIARESSTKEEMAIFNFVHSDINYLKTNNLLGEFIVEKKNYGTGFFRNKHLINENIKIISKYSLKYKNLVNNIDLIIVLLDKLLYKFSLEDQNAEYFEIIINLQEHFNEIRSDNDENRIVALKSIYDSIIWFWKKISTDIIPGLFPGEVSISKLLEYIIDSEGKSCIDDQYVKVLVEAMEIYDALDSGNEYEVRKYSESSLKCQMILCIILPTYIYEEKLLCWTSEIKIGKSEDKDMNQLLSVIKNEYIELQCNYAERNIDIELIYNKILENDTIIIKGKNGSGKSSIIGKLVEKLSDEKYGKELSLSIILYSFKHSKNIYDLIKSIIYQTNVTLVNKIDETILDQVTKEYNMWSGNQMQVNKTNTSNVYNIYKKIIQEVLANFILEHGEIYIFIDSMELANDYEDDVKNLFTDLPSNSHIVFCTIEDNKSLDKINRDTHIGENVVTISELSKEEISHILNLSFADIENIEVIDKIYEKTNGNIKLIKSLIEKVGISEKDILEYLKDYENEIHKKNTEEFERLANKWILFHTDILEETLLILALFETINFISLDKIQSYLNFKGYDVRLPKIKKFLNKVDEQIVYINNKAKLANGELAKFVIENFFSNSDMEIFVSDLFSWICNNIKNEYNFAIAFFKYLIKKKLINENQLDKNFNNFISKKKDNNEDEYLYHVGMLMYYENKQMEKYFMKMIESASELNNCKAKTFLGYCYMIGECVSQDISKAEVLLKEACEAGDSMAKSILGKVLISGIYLKRDSEKGKKLLFEASKDGDVDAKLSLAAMLISGNGIKPNPLQGRELLCELIEDNNTMAMLFLGRFMLDGVSMERNVDEGLKLIEKAIELGNIDAKIDLAERLIYGNGIEEDKLEGFRMLEEVSNSGNIKAKRKLARLNITRGDAELGSQLIYELIEGKDSSAILECWRLILNKKLSEEKKEMVLELLREEAKNNNVDAMRLLGISLIRGDGVDRNVEEGIDLLKYCVSKSDVESMRILGYNLANGVDIMQDKELGETLLLDAVERGDTEAKVSYALTLINNYSDEYNVNKSIRLLDEAASCGNIYAKLNLFDIFINGRTVKKDIERALKLLNDCIEWGDRQATRIMAFMTLNGIDVPYDPNMAKRLLIKAKNDGDELAKTILGEAIVKLRFPEYSVEQGIELLEDAACQETMAECILGKMLICGRNIAQDKFRGMALLKSSAEKGNTAAKRNLYNMLLDGKYLEQNIEEGKNYLMNAVESNDYIAKMDFARRLLDGKAIKRNENQGKKIFEDLINQNNSDAMCQYGDRLINGDGVIKNKPKGENLLRKAIELGNKNARRLLAINIIENKLQINNIDEAVSLFEKNILESDERTMILYGEMLINGEKVVEDIDRGIKLLEECSNRKNSTAQYYLGKRLVKGKKVNQDINRGINLLEASFAEGDESSGIFLAMVHINGKYVKQDIDKGIAILSNLSSEGYEEAQEKLAMMLIKGDRIQRDYIKGIDLIEKLCKKKETGVMVEYGEMLLDGFYVEKDLRLGHKLLNDAIKEGDYYAAYRLGRRLFSGRSIKRHKSHASKYLHKAIKHGIVTAKFEYGIRLKNGLDLALDIDKGKSIINEVLDKSDAEEKYYLGITAYKFNDYELATQLFYDAYKDDVEGASVSLAYMLRRNEINGKIELPDIPKLLENEIKNNSQNAKINLALHYVRRNDKYQDWEKVNEIFSKLDYCGEAAEWWYETSRNGDLEGELVLGLMDRYGLIPELSNETFIERFGKVNNNGWDIPNWMFNNITAYSQIAVTKEN
ncbi:MULTISPECIES: metallophosphoesterase [Clostridium]|uniref:metallophosphoesterase n=1 Tax=Clostridium TaxID=1485 RepID=UPI0015E15E21|nr:MULTISPECIES: metallophosphoesterase [Clostridium]MBN7575670.1 SEL1-like repeat protein [Clostridium beijerinckii]MBN7580561.1 SEL1-like repeat protein [Clostridium beijerinckii]MBN7585447.1 SEL1-like repeat protein [Clostridium beijerinckii]MBO0520704.1 SEL1-like repeat protein [Clostridium beijerinckii]